MLEGELEIEATYESVAQAVRDAGYGESTLLACRGALGLDQAVTVAEQHRQALGLEEEVRITVGHGRMHVQPSDMPVRRRLPRVPGGLDRRSVFDRRIGERRAPADGAATPLLVHGERRSGTDRRSGADRRKPARTGVPR
jgi:hypothetical protein